MQYLYIDESGSMTSKYANHFPYFVISVVRVFDREALKRKLKIFVSKNYKLLKDADKENKMFLNGKFVELKGVALTYDLKIKLSNYLLKYCRGLFEVNIILIKNKNIVPKTYDNTARAFNYFINLFMTNKLHKGDYLCDDYEIQIDERNTKTNAQKSMEDYLSIDLTMKQELAKSISIKYYDSCRNNLIQLSDFFSNLYYSFLMHKESYSEVITKLRKEKMLIDDFIFPQESSDTKCKTLNQ